MEDSKPKNTKLDVTLTPPSLVRACARALQSGIDKGYVRESYLNGDIRDYKASLYRHILEYLEGHTVDSESGLSVLDHIVANVGILIELEEQNKKEDGVIPLNSEDSEIIKTFKCKIIDDFYVNGMNYKGLVRDCRSIYFSGYEVYIEGVWRKINRSRFVNI